jgi:PhnB protein
MPQPIPAGHEGLIPHLVCDPCADAIEFYKKAFGAQEISRAPTPDGRKIMHAEIRIDGRPVFLNDDFPEFCEGKPQSPKALGGTPVTIHRYVEDCDAAIRRAHAAGATVTMPPMDAFWGDRYGMVTDPFGHRWSLATHVRDLTPQQIAEGMQEAFAQS